MKQEQSTAQRPRAELGQEQAEPREHERTESKDYWDLVLEQLGRRKLFKLALAILTLLYGVAAFAPLLVNDKPYVIEAVDLDAYDVTVRRAKLHVGGMESAVLQTDEEE